MSEEKVIMQESDEAATFRTGLSGWVSSTGQYFGNGPDAERMARYAGSTHSLCECGKAAKKPYIRCEDCRRKQDEDAYLKLPEVIWDGVMPLAIFDDDKYFFDEDDILQYCEDNDCISSDIRLVTCTPNKYTEVNCDAIAPEDVSPEDYDGYLPKPIQTALDALNKTIREYTGVFSWSAGKERVTVIIDQETNPK